MRIATFDTESDGFVPEATIMWCASVVDHETGEAWSVDVERFPDSCIVQLTAKLEEYDVIIGHNSVGHDLPLIKKLCGWTPPAHVKVVDTLLMSRVQDPNRRVPPHCPMRAGPHSVQAWGYRLGHMKVAHDEWDRYSPEMLHRCIEDTHIQVKIYHELMKEGKGRGWGKVHRLNAELFTYLREQEMNGMAVDVPLMEAGHGELSRWMERIDGVIKPRLPLVVEIDEGKVKGEYGYVKKPFKKDGSYSAVTERFLCAYADNPSGYCDDDVTVGGPFSRVSFRYTNLDSNAEIKDYLLKQGWIPDQWNENNAGARTSPKLSKDDSFNGIQGALGKLIVRRVRARQRRGIIGGWLEYLDNMDFPNHMTKRLPGIVAGLAVTGRARHKTIVNVPGPEAFYGKRMRQMFIAPPGRVLVGVDSVGNQIRQLAARMGDDDFTAVVLDDAIDIHSHNQERADIETRHAAKTFFYGLIFGAGDRKVAKNLGISLGAAKELRDKFMGGMPAMQELLDRLFAEWQANNGWITGLDGRRIFVPTKHMLLVYLLQSDEAIQMSHAYCLYHRELVAHYPREDWTWVLWMHDEFQIECLPNDAVDIGEIGCWSIAEAGRQLGIPVPHAGEAKIGNNWLETH